MNSLTMTFISRPRSTSNMQVYVSDIEDLKHKKIYDGMGPLNWFLKIFSLNCDCRRKTQRETYCSLLKTFITLAILGFLNCYILNYKMRYVFSSLNISIKSTDIIQTVFDYCQYIVDLYFVYKYGKDISWEYFKQFGSIDRILEMPGSYTSAIKMRLLKLIAAFNVIWIITSLCDFGAWYLSYEWRIPTVYSLAYVFLYIKILTTLDLTSQAIQIECRLRAMGDLLHDCYITEEHLPPSSSVNYLIEDILSKKNWFYSDSSSSRPAKSGQHSHSWKIRCNDYRKVKSVSRCYLLLTEQCVFIKNMYGIRIMLNSLSLLIEMVRFTNMAIRIIVGLHQTAYDSGYAPAVACIMRTMICAAVLTSLVYHCERAYRWANRILSIIDHLLINKNPCEEMRAAATELQGLIQSRPICFNMADFFQLNYSFLLSTASVVVTYTIILLQGLN